jgi:hypothetical protein
LSARHVHFDLAPRVQNLTVPWIILPESAETAAASSQTARSWAGDR